jgi:hypothetical protein
LGISLFVPFFRHAGRLAVIPQHVVEAAGDEDLPAGQRESVDRLRV